MGTGRSARGLAPASPYSLRRMAGSADREQVVERAAAVPNAERVGRRQSLPHEISGALYGIPQRDALGEQRGDRRRERAAAAVPVRRGEPPARAAVDSA